MRSIPRNWWLIGLLILPLAAQGPQQKPPQTIEEYKLENAQLRLQLALVKEQLIQSQYQLIEMEKMQAQKDVEAAQKETGKDKTKGDKP